MTKRPNIQVKNQTDGAVADYAEQQGLDKSEAYEELLTHALDFRPPTEDEETDLVEYLKTNQGYTDEEAEHTLHTADVAVLDDFISGSPGYRGPLIFAVYGYPETYTLYQYSDDGTLVEVEREAQK